MLKNENINQSIKNNESKKARKSVIALCVFYYPMLFLIFNNYYSTFIENSKLSHYKFTTLSLVTAVLVSLIIVAITKIINSKFYIRDKQELKSAFTFSFLIYVMIQMLYLISQGLFTSQSKFYIGIYIISFGIVFFLFLFDYDVYKLGIYTNDIEDFVFYSTERKFIFKEDLRNSGLQHSVDPLDSLKSIIKSQTATLPLHEDLNNVGKYYTYFIQKYDYEDKTYVLLYFSNTGKSIDEIISVNISYDKDEYTTKLAELNEYINEYLKYD